MASSAAGYEPAGPNMKAKSNISGEIVDAVLGRLNSDNASLRACALVSHSWCSLAQCHLFDAVVCRPDAPHFSPRHLSSYLSSAPHVVTYVRSLKIIGSMPASEIEVAVEDVLLLLSSLPNLRSLFFERVPLFTRARVHDPPVSATALPGAKLSTIGLCAIRYTDTTDSFFRVLRECLGSRPLRAILRFVDRDDHSSLPAFLKVFGPSIEHLSLNLLGAIGDFRMLAAVSLDLADDLVYERFELNVDAPTCTTVKELVVYVTGSGVSDPDVQLMLLTGQFLALDEMMKFLPSDIHLRSVTLRFQRFGPHTDATMRMLKDILEPSNWFHNGWMQRSILRFEDLEALTCVVCDGGLAEQYGDYLPANSAASSVEVPADRQEEYEFYADFLRKTYSQFHEKGVLRIQRA